MLDRAMINVGTCYSIRIIITRSSVDKELSKGTLDEFSSCPPPLFPVHSGRLWPHVACLITILKYVLCIVTSAPAQQR